MNKKILIISYFLFITEVIAESNIRIVGSKTLYYFLAFIVEDYAKLESNLSPIIEASGSGSGINLLCINQADIAASSRKITKIERKRCKKNGIKKLGEFIIGKDAVIIASSKASQVKNLSSNSLYKIIADKSLVSSNITENFYYNWKQLNDNFLEEEIKIYGPYISSGTRHVLMEKLADKYCINNKLYIKIFPDYKYRLQNCLAIRNDSRYIEIGDNQNLLVNKLLSNDNAIIILSYSQALPYKDQINFVKIDNIYPNKSTIFDGTYLFSRNLYIYYDEEKFESEASRNNFLTYLKNSNLLKKDSFLAEKGLITLSK